MPARRRRSTGRLPGYKWASEYQDEPHSGTDKLYPTRAYPPPSNHGIVDLSGPLLVRNRNLYSQHIELVPVLFHLDTVSIQAGVTPAWNNRFLIRGDINYMKCDVQTKFYTGRPPEVPVLVATQAANEPCYFNVDGQLLYLGKWTKFSHFAPSANGSAAVSIISFLTVSVNELYWGKPLSGRITL